VGEESRGRKREVSKSEMEKREAKEGERRIWRRERQRRGERGRWRRERLRRGREGYGGERGKGEGERDMEEREVKRTKN
jgi:hypothetical protein